MFGIGSTELLVILVVALLVLGPKNLPQIARTLGKAMGEFRRVSTDFQRTLNTEVAFEEASEKRKKEAEEKKKAEEAKPTEEKKQEESRTAAEAAEMASQAAPVSPAPDQAPLQPEVQEKSV